MASAEPCKDPEPGLLSGRVIDEKGQQSLYQDDRASSHPANSPRSSYRLWARDKMPSFRRTTLTVLIVVFLTVAYAAVPMYRMPQDSSSGARDTSFQELLNSVSDASLHDVLVNVYGRYKHGIFREDRTAMQAVHDDNAAIATSLVELARRQNPNVTSVTADSSTATVVVVPTTETTTVMQTSGTNTVVVVDTQTTVTPVQTTSPVDTSVQTTATQVSSNPPSEFSSSVPVPVQSSISVQSVNSSLLSGSSLPASVPPPSNQANPTSQTNPTLSSKTSTNGGTSSGTATAASSPSATTLIKTSSSTVRSTSPGQAGASSSEAAGPVTAESSSTQQVVFTTTLPDGSQSTVTSFTVIPAGEQASVSGAAGTSVTGAPSLQNGAVDGNQPRGVGLVGSLAAALVFVIGIL